MPVDLMTPTMYREDEVVLFMLGAFLLLVIALLTRQVPLKGRLSAFFGISSDSELTDYEKNNLKWVHGLLAIMTSLLGATLYYFFAQERWNLQLISLHSWQLLTIYSGIILLLLLIKQRVLALVNYIFFKKEQRGPWNRDYSMIFSAESILIFLLTIAAVFFDLSMKKVFIGLLVLLLFVKFLVFSIDLAHFFGKFHCVLHLFVYFCTLEAAPLLVLWATLDRLTKYMITNL